MENTLSRQEHGDFHSEFARRQDMENERQNRRIELLEENMQQINDLKVTVEKMAVNVDNLLEEQRRQGERLEKLEMEPADQHRQNRAAIVTAVIGTVIGAVVTAILTLL